MKFKSTVMIEGQKDLEAGEIDKKRRRDSMTQEKSFKKEGRKIKTERSSGKKEQERETDVTLTKWQ